MYRITKTQLVSLSSIIVVITALFWLLPALFPFEGSPGGLSSFAAQALDLFSDREQAQIGEHKTVDLRIRYSDAGSSTRTIHEKDASFIKVHFLSLDLLPGDYVTVSDPAGQQVYTYPEGSDFTSDGGAGFWALTIFGSSLEITLHTRYSTEELQALDMDTYGVLIDKYAKGLLRTRVHDYSYLPESVCGADERVDAVCYKDSHPVEFSRSEAVAMHVYNGTGWCSAWRVGPGDLMFTNEHCLSSQAELEASEFWFGHQRSICGERSPQNPVIVTGKNLLSSDYLKDYALFSINDAAKIERFGWLEIDARPPLLDETIYIPQQPGGLFPDDQRKVIALRSDVGGAGECRIDQPLADGRWLNTDAGYSCDTSPGASGSPVLARASHAVISLHHLGGCRNRGVRMDQIWPMVSEVLTPEPDLVSVSVPDKAVVGEMFPVRIEACNEKAASPEGILSVSILYSDSGTDLSLENLHAPWADRLDSFQPGAGPLLDQDCQEIDGGFRSHVVEAVDLDWEADECRTLEFNVAPHRQGTLWLQVRNSMKDVRAGCHYVNDASLTPALGVPAVDQGGWEVVQIPVRVEPGTSDSGEIPPDTSVNPKPPVEAAGIYLPFVFSDR